jgi:RNA polymerase-interacting CarD/CdnL/TRCF family regulator
MELTTGDKVSTLNLAIGEYCGKEKIKDSIFLKIQDLSSKLTVYIPTAEIDKIHRLPRKETIHKVLKVMKVDNFLHNSDKVDSRYKFYKDKMESASFKNSVEIFHDLSLLQAEKKISTSEKKLWVNLKAKLIEEIKHVLNIEEVAAEKMLSLQTAL